MRSIVLGALCAAALVVNASMANAQTVSPGKKAAYGTFTSVPITNGFTTGGSVSIEKGQKKRVVEIDVSIVEATNAAQVLATLVMINGTQIGSIQLTEGCTAAYFYCTVQGSYWADIDELEAANPGLFVGQPLLIEAQTIKVTTPSSTPVTGTVSIRARVVKK